jgi:alanine-glyoxylate transaminase/serine-glyoxylate transaminase/serine-pyruvate transaminase
MLRHFKLAKRAGRYAMREALAIVSAEGLSSLWERHQKLHVALWEGLRAMGLKPFVESDADRLVSVNTIRVRSTFPLAER